QRLAQQRLARGPLASAQAVVAWLGAMQAQEYPGAAWSLALRMDGATAAAIDRAFDAGEILRTHVMRPTWHFAAPADLRWLLQLTGPRVLAGNAYRNRQLALDDSTYARTDALIAAALAGGQHLTRTELGAMLAAAGVDVAGQRMPYVLMHAELVGLICSGPKRGKQFTYALLEERVPPAPARSRTDALAELARRYFTSHGPATVHDFVWWSGLTVADARAGLAAAGDTLAHETVAGKTYHFAATPEQDAASAPAAYLLPTYDEFLVGYAAFGAARQGATSGGQGSRAPLLFQATVVADGQVIGTWQRTLRRDAVAIEVAPFAPLTDAQAEAISAAAARYSAFHELPLAGPEFLRATGGA
ncbi:MAG TPA: winged helix DNA-binding domain-containing protein, partial [Ktedonobacterales bacterium]